MSNRREAIALGAAVRAHNLWGDIGVLPQSVNKRAASQEYKGRLEMAYLDQVIDDREYEMLTEFKKSNELSEDDVKALEIDILGKPLSAMIRKAIKKTTAKKTTAKKTTAKKTTAKKTTAKKTATKKATAKKEIIECPHGHGKLKLWEGELRCWKCGWTEKKTIRNVSQTNPPLRKASVTPKEVMKLIGHYTSRTPVDSTYVLPCIPPEKLRAATNSFAPIPKNMVLLLHDSTVFGSAKEGFAMTSTDLYWKDMNDAAKSISFSEISTVVENRSATFMGAGLTVNGIPLTPNGGFSGKRACKMFCALIKAIRDLHTGG